MKIALKIGALGAGVVLMFLLDLALVPEAHAVAGTRRRTARRTAVVVSSADSAQVSQSEQEAAEANAEAEAAKQEAAEANAEAEAAKQEAAAAKAAAAAPPPPAPATGPLPIGTVVTALPAGCATTAIGGVEYYQCGGNYYRAAFQGNQLVYVTTQP